ncbi:putative zinc finger protein, partial [Orchesella cincta]
VQNAGTTRNKVNQKQINSVNVNIVRDPKLKWFQQQIVTRYLGLSVDLDSKDDTKVAFCSGCASLVTKIYEVYKEFRAVELQLSTKLEELGEIMIEKSKMGESCLSRRSLNGRGNAYIEKVRNVIAQDLMLKRRKLELELDTASLNEDKDCQEGEDLSATKNCDEEEEVVVKSEVEPLGDIDDQPSAMDNIMDEDSSSFNPPAESGQDKPPRSRPSDKNEECNHDDSESEASDSDASYIAAADEVDASESESDSGSDVSCQEDSEDSHRETKTKTMKRRKSPNLSKTEAKRTKTTKPSETETIPEPEKPKFSFNDYIEGPFHCESCDKPYERWQVFWKHLTRVHEEPATEKHINCPFCWTSYAYHQTFSYHLKSKHEETLTKPVFSCDAEFADSNTITTIQLACDQSFMTMEELNTHLLTHSEKIFYCSCKWGFLSPDMLELHKLNHIRSIRGNLKCPKCDIVSAGFAKLTDHFNLRHGAKLLIRKCPICPTSCLSRIALQTHLKNHETGKITPARPHVSSGPQVCELCGMTYKGAKADERLQRHMQKIHSGAEIICDICQQVFTFGIQYDRHLKNAHSISKLTCEVCHKELGSTRRLREHMNIVHSAQPENHLCQHCGNNFKTKRYLQRHIVWMHKELTDVQGKHVCECGEKFHRIELFKRHKKTPCQKTKVENPDGRNDFGVWGAQT